MTAADEFFRSLREVFARNRDANWATVGLIAAAVVTAIAGASIFARRRRSRREMQARIDGIAATAGLRADDLSLVSRVAC